MIDKELSSDNYCLDTHDKPESIIRSYLLQIRDIVELSEIGKEILKINPCTDAKDYLIKYMNDNDLVKPGTEHLLDKSVSIILSELEVCRKKESLYLIDNSSGKLVAPINKSHLYKPPNFIGLDGKEHESKLMLHPSVSSEIILESHEKEKKDKIVSKYGQDISIAHITKPESIISMATCKLHNLVEICETEGEWTNVEIGKENINGVEQSMNSSFHRVELFSSILAKRIIELCGVNGKCQIGEIKENKGSKLRWFNIMVRPDKIT